MEAEDRKKAARARLGELDWTPEDHRLFPPAARAAAAAAVYACGGTSGLRGLRGPIETEGQGTDGGISGGDGREQFGDFSEGGDVGPMIARLAVGDALPHS